MLLNGKIETTTNSHSQQTTKLNVKQNTTQHQQSSNCNDLKLSWHIYDLIKPFKIGKQIVYSL